MKLLLHLIFIFFLCAGTVSGQSSAPATAPSGPTNTAVSGGQASAPATTSGTPSSPTDIISVLQKAGDFTTFIGLLKSSQVDALINTQLKKSNQGFTMFAPTDAAFQGLKTGTLNSFSDEQKAALTKFHVIPSFITISQFQTVSNPVHTQAGENTVLFPLNVIGNGTHVNITTGLVNTTVESTVYSDGGQLAVYEVPQVLLSQGVLSPEGAAPAPAPMPGKPKTKAGPLNAAAPSRSSTSASVYSSGAMGLTRHAPGLALLIVAITSLSLSRTLCAGVVMNFT